MCIAVAWAFGLGNMKTTTDIYDIALHPGMNIRFASLLNISSI
jgi:hypothetical protein